MTRFCFFLALAGLLSGCQRANLSDKGVSTPTLTVRKVADNVYQHTTFLNTQTFGRVPCNGMIVFDKNEAVVFDTPANDTDSAELIDWISDSLHCKITAIIPTHFHEDCLGGLAEFHRRGIPSYAGNRTIELARSNKYPIPQNGFDSLLELKAGRKNVIARFVGEGHTHDNIIGYVPSEKVMFGGCLIKELNAGKGNLADASVQAWPATVARLKAQYPATRFVIPGHGKPGGTDLLDYTITLFKSK